MVCDDPEPTPNNISYSIVDEHGNPASNPPGPGVYDVIPFFTDPNAVYANYELEVIPGKLWVNPIVNCFKRIKASDLCYEIGNTPGRTTN